MTSKTFIETFKNSLLKFQKFPKIFKSFTRDVFTAHLCT